MRAKSVVLVLIASGCGLVASMGISQVLEKRAAKGNGASVEMEQILVAVKDIDIGEELNAENVKLEPWPKDKIPLGATRDLKQLDSRYPRTRLYPGEPILEAKLMDSNTDVGSLKIPEGYRAVSIKVTMDTSVSGLVLPGDRVDIIAFLRKSGDVPKTMTRTILRDVRVFAVNSETERSVDTGGAETTAKTVSVLLKHSQVEPLMLAHELGTLRLSLRRPNDVSEESGGGVADIDTLLGQKPERADDAQDDLNTAPDNADLADWLKSQQGSQSQSAPPGEPIAAAATNTQPQFVFETVVLEPDGPTFYRWRDLNQLPEVVPAGSAGWPVSALSDPAATDGEPESEPDGRRVDDAPRDSSWTSAPTIPTD